VARETPAARLERERSRTAHAELSSSEARSLLSNKFAPVLGEIGNDPARRAAEVDVFKPLSDFSELIVTESGKKALLESTTPLRVPDDTGAKAQVDLGLVSSGGGYELLNPIIDLALPSRANEEIAMTSSDIGVELVGAGSSVASQLDGNLFYPETYTDTDTLIVPIAQGLEVFEQVRSPQSPEAFDLDLRLPQGATLQEGPHGTGVLVRRGEDVLAHVPPPQATDAQGTSVPAEMTIVGNSLRVSLDHRTGDWAYPILLDPAIRDVYYFPADPNGENDWVYASGNGAFPNIPPTNRYQPTSACTISATCNATWSLYIYPRPDIQYGPTEWGHWIYKAPGQTTYLVSALLTGLDYSYFYDTPRYFYPYTDGWSESNASYAGHNGAGNEWQGPGGVVWSNRSMFHNFNASSPTGDAAASDVEWMVAGVTTDACCYHGPTGWWRTFRLGGADITLLDPENPTLGPPSHSPVLPTGWVDQQSRSVGFSAQDPGLGVKRVELLTPTVGGPLETQTRATGCVGGKRSTCPATLATPGQVSAFSYNTGSFPEGERTVQLKAFDALEKESLRSWSLKVDHTPPQIALSGALPDPDEPGTDLHVRVTDGDPSPTAAPADRRSGVRKVEFLLDGQPVPSSHVTPASALAESDCPTSSCAREFDYNAAGRLSDGKHTYTIRTTDQLGHQAERSFPVEVDRPTTGILDEYLMHYVDSPEDAEGNRDISEMAVNVVNGNLVYRHTDASVPGEDVDLTIDRYYNSQLWKSRGAFGSRWTLGGGTDVTALTQQSGDVTINGPSAYEGSFVKRADGSFGPSDDVHAATLARTSAGGHDLTMEETGNTYNFNSGGRLESATNQNASSLDYVYAGAKLTAARTSEGAEATFSYGPLNLLKTINEIRIGDQRHVYGQDLVSGTLPTYTAPGGGRTEYAYNGNGLLTRIRDYTGDWVFTYDGSNRVTAISRYTTSGSSTTTFAYGVGTTTVTEPSGRSTTYRSGKTGFVTRRQANPSNMNVALSGTLFASRAETLQPGTYSLNATGVAPEGIKSLEVIVNGGLADLAECTGTCESHSLNWTFDTRNYPSSDVVIEVLGVDRDDEVFSRRFEVTSGSVGNLTPQADPPLSFEYRYQEALRFREDFGLSTDPAFVLGTLDDASLAASEGIYGIPLVGPERLVIDRHQDVATAAAALEHRAIELADGAYAGLFVDPLDSSKVRIGFTENANQYVDALRQDFEFPDLLEGFVAPPSASLAALEGVHTQIAADLDLLADQYGIEIVEVRTDVAGNDVEVGVTEPTPTLENFMRSRYGPEISAVTASPYTRGGRTDPQNPMKAGVEIFNYTKSTACTLGFGGYRPHRVLAGDTVDAFFGLTAGHCDPQGNDFWEQGGLNYGRSAQSVVAGVQDTDALKIRTSEERTPRFIYKREGRTLRVLSVGSSQVGASVCLSGAATKDIVCGKVSRRNVTYRDKLGKTTNLVRVNFGAREGDSGGPIFWKTAAIGQSVAAGPSRTLFTPIMRVLTRLDVNLALSACDGCPGG